MPTSKVFPQLSSGAVTQYPIRIRESIRSVVNQTADGRRIRYSEPAASSIEWEISHSALSDAEWSAIEDLFRDCEGRRLSFLFLDPWANLVADSETFTASAWVKGSGISLVTGVSNPDGESRATQVNNSAATLQSISQSLAVPANFSYSFSISARATAATSLRLIVSTDGAFAERLFDVTSDWQRFSVFSSLAPPNSAIDVALQMPAATTIEIFGAQLEAQPAPSPYQRTAGRTGRYPEARFSSDSLAQVTTGPGQHTASIRIRSNATTA